MRNKKLFALVLGAVMVAGAAAPAFADGFQTQLGKPSTIMDDGAIVAVDENGFSKTEVEYTEADLKEGAENATNVYAVIGSTYQVTIPKTIVLKGNKGEASTATYKVDVDGDIAGNQYVKVQPDATFAMKQTGKADVKATVSQELVKYRASNYSADLVTGEAKMAAVEDAIEAGEGTGTVSATLTAGRWAGTFNFDIELVTE